MSEQATTAVTVVKADADFAWEELARPAGDTNPPGEEVILFRSADAELSCGFWRRVPEKGTLAPPFDEIMMILRGEIDVTQGGSTLHAGPGDILSAPNGSSAVWHSHAAVYKFWAVHHGGVGDTSVTLARGTDPSGWTDSSIPPDDGLAQGRERVAFTSADGAFSAGFWERESQDRDFTRDFDEVAVFLEGEADITDGGETLHVGPGDVLLTPRGSSGHWRSTVRVRKFWAIYEGG